MTRTLHRFLTAFLLATSLGGSAMAAPAASGKATADPSAGDAVSNPAFHRQEVLAFMGIKPGDRVADVVAGRFARALSLAVGPAGVVYAVEPTEVVKVHPEVLTMMNAQAGQPGSNIQIISEPINATTFPKGLDIVFIRQNYHDLHDKFMGPADVAAFNRAVYSALKPGGVFVILDHTAARGSGLTATETLHRIDPDAVKTEVTAAGFILDAESPALVNPADPHDKMVFDPSIKGRTDQFLLRFRKPA